MQHTLSDWLERPSSKNQRKIKRDQDFGQFIQKHNKTKSDSIFSLGLVRFPQTPHREFKFSTLSNLYFNSYSSVLEVPTQLLLDFDNLASDLVYQSISSAQGIADDHPMKEPSSIHQQSCFSTECSRRKYGVSDILDIASGYEYQHA